GSNAVDPNTWTEELREREGQGLDTGFRGGIRNRLGIRVYRDAGTDVDDGSAPAGGHPRANDRREPKDGLEVHSEDLVDQRFLRCGDIVDNRRGARVVDKNIHLAELFVGAIDQIIQRVPPTYMASDPQHTPPRGRGDVVRGGVARCLVAAG